MKYMIMTAFLFWPTVYAVEPEVEEQPVEQEEQVEQPEALIQYEVEEMQLKLDRINQIQQYQQMILDQQLQSIGVE